MKNEIKAVSPAAILCLIALFPSSGFTEAKTHSVIKLDFSNPAWTLDAAENYIEGYLNDEWLEARLSQVAQSSQKLAAQNEDLKNAVGLKFDPETLRAQLAQASAGKRIALMEQLPGMKPDPFSDCRSLEYCNRIPTSLRVENTRQVGPAVSALVRPWILLQKARKQEFYVRSINAEEPVLRLFLFGIPAASSMEVHFSPTALGGIELELKGSSDPAALFMAEKRKILAAKI